jgi:hypothetical protein
MLASARNHLARSSPPDIPAILHPRKRHLGQRRVSLAQSLLQVRSDRRHPQHSPTGSHQLSRSNRGPGVEQLRRSRPVAEGRSTRNRPTQLHRSRIPGARRDHAHARTSLHPDRKLLARTCDRPLQQIQQVAVQPHHQRLRLRIAEPRVELQHLRSRGRQHDPTKQHPTERRSFRPHSIHRPLRHILQQPRPRILRDQRVSRIRPHSTRIGSCIALADALVVLRHAQRHCSPAIAQREVRHLRPFQHLLDHHLPSRDTRHLALQHGRGRIKRLLDRLADHHALSRRQTIRLHHHPAAHPCQRALYLDHAPAHRTSGGRNPVPLHEPLGKRLAGLQHRRRLGRPKHRQPPCLQRIHQAHRQRKLRSNHGHGRHLRLHQPHHLVHIAHIHRHAPCHRSDPTVARRTHHLSHPPRTPQGPAQRMLPSTTANHQNLHRRKA